MIVSDGANNLSWRMMIVENDDGLGNDESE